MNVVVSAGGKRTLEDTNQRQYSNDNYSMGRRSSGDEDLGTLMGLGQVGSQNQGKDDVNPDGDGRPVASQLTIRDRIWLFFDDPSYSLAGYFLSLFILSLITLSCTAFVVETIPSMCCGRYDSAWNTIEVVCVTAFTIEYLTRLLFVPVWANPDRASLFNWNKREDGNIIDIMMREFMTRIRFFFKILNIVDFAAILPFFIVAALPAVSGSSGTAFLRVIRLARVFRLFKLSKYSEGMHLLSNTMVRSWRALGMLFFFMVISIIVFSSIMHFVERGAYFYCTATAASPIDGSPPKCNVGDISPHNSTEGLGLEECDRWANEGGSNSMSDKRLECCFGETWYAYPPTDSNGDGCADKSKFESIPATAWWCVVTMTTVGYGDVVPLTTEGKLVAMLTMIGGILILALPITVIGSNFNIEYENSEQQKNQKKDLAEAASSSNSVQGKPLTGNDIGVTASGGLTVTLRNTADQQRLLLQQVEQLLQQQRHAVVARAEEMMLKHVRDIAREVVEQHLASGGVSAVEEPLQPR